jgi:hypothetical protein
MDVLDCKTSKLVTFGFLYIRNLCFAESDDVKFIKQVEHLLE